MARRGVWFGTLYGDNARMQWIKPQSVGMAVRQDGYREQFGLENGGAVVVGSRDGAYTYDMSWNGNANDSFDINIIQDYYDGMYGNGYLYFSDPMWYDVNVMRKNWATPFLLANGFKNIYMTDPTFGPGTTAFGHTGVVPTWTIDHTFGTQPTDGHRFSIAIPEGMTLWVGASGTATGAGNATVAVRPIGGAEVPLTLLDPTASTRLNYSVASTTASGVEVYLTRTVDDEASLTLSGVMAQLHPTGVTPALTGNHQSGRGVGGMKFSNETQESVYTMFDRKIRTYAASLTEVEWWMRSS